MLETIFNIDIILSFLTLTILEIILGIDNIVFIALLTSKLPKEDQVRGYRLGLMGALFSRIVLLMLISWLAKLTVPLFTFMNHEMSVRSLILLSGGGFLIIKSVHEIYEDVEGIEEEDAALIYKSFVSVIFQIIVLDIIFSLDSVITAVGMVDNLGVMISAIIVAVGVMLFFAKPINTLVTTHPSIKILALAFLILIGVALVAESFGQHFDKRFIYSSMGFAFAVELLNMRIRSKKKKVKQKQLPE